MMWVTVVYILTCMPFYMGKGNGDKFMSREMIFFSFLFILGIRSIFLNRNLNVLFAVLELTEMNKELDFHESVLG